MQLYIHQQLLNMNQPSNLGTQHTLTTTEVNCLQEDIVNGSIILDGSADFGNLDGLKIRNRKAKTVKPIEEIQIDEISIM